MTRAAKDIASDISKAFGGEFKINGKTYTMKTDVQITAVTSMDDVSSSDQRVTAVYNYRQGYLNRGDNSMMIRGVLQPNPYYKYFNYTRKRSEVIHINSIGLNHKY